jgi:hypothetical protein
MLLFLTAIISQTDKSHFSEALITSGRNDTLMTACCHMLRCMKVTLPPEAYKIKCRVVIQKI